MAHKVPLEEGSRLTSHALDPPDERHKRVHKSPPKEALSVIGDCNALVVKDPVPIQLETPSVTLARGGPSATLTRGGPSVPKVFMDTSHPILSSIHGWSLFDDTM
jgi:hypothetical protein